HGSMPNIAVRLEAPGRLAVTYSSDTEPCDAVADLAHGAHTLIHEATYSERRTVRIGVHSPPPQAAPHPPPPPAPPPTPPPTPATTGGARHAGRGGPGGGAGPHFGGEVEGAGELVPSPL